MKADLTRNTFHPLKHFTRVLMQQGRVQLDADWNEQGAILLRYLQALAADVIGPQGGPKDAAGNVGFAIAPLQTVKTPQSVAGDFVIGAGHYYVDGILCEVDSTPVPITSFPNTNQVQVLIWPLDDLSFRKNHYIEVFDDGDPSAPSAVQAKITNLSPKSRTLTLDAGISSLDPFKSTNVGHPSVRLLTTYLTQPDYPVPNIEELKLNTSYQVYLDVWERLMTYVEDDRIREVALGGPDTAARVKVVWQVKVIAGKALNQDKSKSPCDRVNFQPDDPDSVPIVLGINRGLLKAKAKEDSTATDPCITPPDARYRGPENQLYRVEIHRGGKAWDGTHDPPTGAATFKWSRENGSVVFPIAGGGGTNTLTLETLGRDDRFGLAERDWVEVLDDDYVLQNRSGNLLSVQSIDRTDLKVTLSGVPDPNGGKDASKHPLLRRWDQKAGDPTEGGLQLGSDNAALIVEDSNGNWLDLEDGIQIQFQKPEQGQPDTVYRTGDYWLIPARTATGDVEWPSEIQKDDEGNPERVRIAKPPDGVTHHYAPLAVITVGGEGQINVVTPTCQPGYDTLTKRLNAQT